MKIIQYINASNVIVEFQDDYKYKVHCAYREFKNGKVKNPYDKTFYNVGYTGVGKYKARKNNEFSIQYKYWQSMLRRCYSEEYHKKQPTYVKCQVDAEWLNFQNFAKWVDENFYEVEDERIELDKDILLKGNKSYNKYNCVFVPQSINMLFTKNNIARGKYPIGITEHFDKLEVSCKNFNGKRIYLGLYEKYEVLKAFNTYKKYKENLIKEVADLYKNKIPIVLYNAMKNYIVEIDD